MEAAVTAAVTDIAGLTTTVVGPVGAAVVGVVVGIAGFQLLRRMVRGV